MSVFSVRTRKWGAGIIIELYRLFSGDQLSVLLWPEKPSKYEVSWKAFRKISKQYLTWKQQSGLSKHETHAVVLFWWWIDSECSKSFQFFQLLFVCFFFGCTACEILVSWLGIEPGPLGNDRVELVRTTGLPGNSLSS